MILSNNWHMHNNGVTKRRQEYAMAIRRQHVEERKKEIRTSLQYGLAGLKELSAMLDLPARKQPYTYFDIISLRKEELLRPTRNIDDHSNFWMHFSLAVFEERQKCGAVLVDFMLEFITINSHSSIHRNIIYELQVLNMIEVVSPAMSDPQKSQVLLWIRGTEGLRLIQSCLLNRFLSVRTYMSVYRVIQLGFRSELKKESIEAAETLFLILREADWDDTFSIYEHCFGLITQIMRKVKVYYELEEVSKYADCLIYLLDTYNETLLECARSGVGLIAAELITSKIDANTSKGLQMMRILAEVDKCSMIRFLLENADIVDTRVWEVMCGPSLREHRSISIRKDYYRVIQRMIVHGQQEEVIQITNRFTEHHSDIFEVFQEALRIQDEIDILVAILNCLKTLIYYGQYLREGEENKIVRIIAQKTILNHIRVIGKHQHLALCALATEILSSCE